jgi:hypothetical protein
MTGFSPAMKSLLGGLFLLVTVCYLFGQAGYHFSSADEAYSSWSRLNRTGPQRTGGTDDKQVIENFWRDKAVLMKEASDAFMRDFPGDGRRWELALRAAQISRWLESEHWRPIAEPAATQVIAAEGK